MGSNLFGAVIGADSINEVTFYKKIKEYVTELDSRITCDTDVDAEFDSSSDVATLTFKVNNVDSFKLYRPSARDTSVYSINFGMLTDAAGKFSADSIHFRKDDYMTTTAAYTATIKRYLTVSHMITDNYIFISFTSAQTNGTYRVNDHISFLWTKSGDIIYVSSSNSNLSSWSSVNVFNVSGYTLYDSTLANQLGGTFVSRFSYAAPAGSIDYIKSSIYQNSGQKVLENTAIYDCTTVTVGDTVSLKDGSYYAVGPHQLIKVS